MPREKKHGKRNSSEQQIYKDFLSNPQNRPEDTSAVNNSTLIGTNVAQHDDLIQRSESPIKTPICVRLKKWAKENKSIAIIGPLIFSAILTFVVWTVSSIHQNDIHIAVIENDVEHLEHDVQEMDTDEITKTMLKYEIETVKDELESDWRMNISEIENRINLIEMQIKFAQDKD